MITVTLGTDTAVEQYRLDVSPNLSSAELESRAVEAGVTTDDDPSNELLAARLDAVVYKRPAPGLRTVTSTFEDDWSTMKIANAITSSKGIWDSHSPGDFDTSGAPLWVASDSPALEALLAEHFGCTAGAPADVEDLYYTESGPPGTGPMTAAEAYQNLNMLRVDAGKDFQARVMADTASTGTGSYASARFMAVTENTANAPAAADTTLVGELTAFGFARVAAAYAHTAGVASYTLTNAFTSSDATTRTLQQVGIFNAVSAGTLVFKTLIPSPPSLVSGDIATITETVTL